MKKTLLSCCAIAALTVIPTNLAHAQDAAGAGDSPALRVGSGDIVVTARRREERIQDVPVAITAFSQEALQAQGVRSVSDLRLVTPGLNASPSASAGRMRPTYELRGIFPGDVQAGQDQAVGIYVNDVYFARPTGTNQSLFDIENVQVLFGPQGTLFGRNTTGGAVLITSKRPTDEFEGEMWAGMGNYDAVTVGGIVNLPVNDKVQFRFAGQRELRDGFFTDVVSRKKYDNVNTYSLRGTMRIAPSDSFENVTIVDYFRNTDNFSAGVLSQYARPGETVRLADGNIALLSSAAIGAYPGLPAYIAAQEARGPRRVQLDVSQSSYTRTWGLANISTLELSSDLTLKNIFSYRNVVNRSFGDTDKSPFGITTGDILPEYKQYSEELQLQGKSFDNRLTWIVGGFYFHERADEREGSSALRGTSSYAPITRRFLAENTSKSIFAQATYSIFEGLNFTAGGRYNWDTRKALWDNARIIARGEPPVPSNVCAFAPDFNLDGDCRERRRASFKEPTYSLTLDYHPTENVMVYVAHRRGYRSGGFNGRAASQGQATPFNPEIVTDFEVGAKGRVEFGTSSALSADIALYRTKYDAMQRSIIVVNPVTGGVINSIFNAGESTIKGFEFKSTLTIIPEISISANWAHHNGKYNTFNGLNVCPASDTPPCTAADRRITQGRNLPFGTAKDTVNAVLTLTPLNTPEMGTITATGSYSYRSSWFLQNDTPVLAHRIAPYSIFNINLEWDKIGGSDLSAQVFVRNLFDKDYVVGGISTLTSLGYATDFYGDPRTVGAMLRYKF